MAGQLCCPAGFLGGGGVTPSPTPSVSDTFFWRYDNQGDATWLVNTQGQLVHAKRQVGIDDVSIGFFRNTGGNTVGIEGTTQVTEQWGEQRAEFDGSPEADWSITMDDETLSYNGVLSSNVKAWVPVTPVAHPVLYRTNPNGSRIMVDNEGKIYYFSINDQDKFFSWNSVTGWTFENAPSAFEQTYGVHDGSIPATTESGVVSFTIDGSTYAVQNGVVTPELTEWTE